MNPAEDQTSSIPDNWMMKTIGDLASYVRGVTYDKSLSRTSPAKGYTPLLRATNIDSGALILEDFVYVPEDIVKAEQLLQIGDLVIAASSGSSSVVGKSAPIVTDFSGTFGAFCAVIRADLAISNKFLGYYIQSPSVRELWSSLARGTNINNLKRDQVCSTPIAVPPRNEQDEIVRILEEQFSRLDAAAASIAAVRRKADQFRRSVLHAAFTGRLTQHGTRRVTVELSANSVVLPSGWTSRQLGDCGDWIGGGTPSKSNEKFWTNGTIPWLSPKDMGPTVISETQDKITPDALQGSATALVASNSVAVVVRSGILERRLPAALVPFETTLNQDMKALEVRGDILPKWVLYALHAFNHEILAECRKAGTTVASIEFPRLRMYEIPVAPPDEQQEVVRLLEEQFSRQEAILTVADAADRKVAALRRSLLHAAFSGELTKEWREKNNG